jgi:biotin carboxyl carrier protein
MSSEIKQQFLNIDSSLYKTRISSKFENRKKYIPDDPRLIRSFIPGTVLEISVVPGTQVSNGDQLMTVDAMKMKNRIKSNVAGKVKSIAVKPGDKVSKGTILLELE